MVVKGIHGDMRQCKTTVLSWFAYDAYKNGRTVYCNYELKFPHETLDIKKCMDLELSNCFVAFDEMQQFMDVALSGSEKQRFFSYWILQTGKLDVDLVYSSHQIYVDEHYLVSFRLRDFTQIKYFVTAIRNNPLDFDETPKGIRLKIIPRGGRMIKIVVKNINNLFTLFDTKYKVEFMKSLLPEKRQKKEVAPTVGGKGDWTH